VTGATAPGSSQPTAFRPAHAPVGYHRFLATRTGYSLEWQRDLHHAQERFQNLFPDLEAWFARPLRERLGWRGAEQQARRSAPSPDLDPTACWVSFNARPYLLWLSLTGRLRLDWGWLLGIGVLKRWQLVASQLGLPLVDQVEQIAGRAAELGLTDKCHERIRWGVARLVLHRADPDLGTLTIDEVEELREAIRQVRQLPGIDQVLSDRQLATTPVAWATCAYQTGVALFHAGVIDRPPRRERRELRGPLSARAKVQAVMHRYVTERALVDRPSSLNQTRAALRRLGMWLDAERPKVQSLAELGRTDLVEFLTWLHEQPKQHSAEPLAPSYYRTHVWQLVAFFRHISQAEWDDAPVRPLLLNADVPRAPLRVPRYIPREQLDPLMAAIRQLACPLQRAALLVARWSGARRSEIRRLHLDCLDAYPDGTPRLRLAIGKSGKERMVPVHQEAADAIRVVQQQRRREPDRGVRDPDLGYRVRYLFVQQGRLASPDYLFGFPLAEACAKVDLVDEAGHALVTPHRFRHTLGTQLAEQGARTRAIMAILGHQSAHMSMTYAAISDAEVLRDYQSVLAPGAVLAGPQAAAIRQGAVSQEALDWLKTNFYKTELELGRCLRLPQEGPCECDLYLSCAKFVTTRDYAPRLRQRLVVEQELAADAEQRGWGREVERHQRIAQRIRCLLAELGEPDVVS
jgi:integrase